MAITRTARGVTNSKAAPTNLTINVSGVLTAGNSLIVTVASDTSPSSVQLKDIGDAAIGTFVKDAEAVNSGHVFAGIWSLINLTSTQASTGVRVELNLSSGSQARAFAVSEVSGLASSNALAVDKSSTGIGSSATPSSGATATLSQASEICFGVVGTEGPGQTGDDLAGTWSNSWNNGQRDGTTGSGATANMTVSEGYLIVSANTAQTAAKTGITSRNWGAAIVTYKEAAVTFLAKPPYLVSQSIKRSASW